MVCLVASFTLCFFLPFVARSFFLGLSWGFVVAGDTLFSRSRFLFAFLSRLSKVSSRGPGVGSFSVCCPFLVIGSVTDSCGLYCGLGGPRGVTGGSPEVPCEAAWSVLSWVVVAYGCCSALGVVDGAVRCAFPVGVSGGTVHCFVWPGAPGIGYPVSASVGLMSLYERDTFHSLTTLVPCSSRTWKV